MHFSTVDSKRELGCPAGETMTALISAPVAMKDASGTGYGFTSRTTGCMRRSKAQSSVMWSDLDSTLGPIRRLSASK